MAGGSQRLWLEWWRGWDGGGCSRQSSGGARIEAKAVRGSGCSSGGIVAGLGGDGAGTGEKVARDGEWVSGMVETVVDAAAGAVVGHVVKGRCDDRCRSRSGTEAEAVEAVGWLWRGSGGPG